MNLQKDTVEKCIQKCLEIIRLYDWLIDLYVLDFFVDNHWERLPKTWQQCLDNLDPTDLGKILTGTPVHHVFPLSLLALFRTVETYSITRKPNGAAYGHVIRNNSLCSNHPKFKNLFLKHVKLKKRHEISVMAEVVHKVSTELRCKSVLDFGSGLGHLVRVLGYKYDMRAAGLECQPQLTTEARKLDLELESTAGKYLTPSELLELHRPIHLTITLSSECQMQDLELPKTMKPYGLVGLHPCGDLGPLLLKHFVNSNNVNFICIVGCCYMKLTCAGNDNGYPMSRFLNSIEGHHLSYASREIACHAIETYCDKLKKGDYQDLKVHAYRAALEVLLVAADPALRHAPVRSVKHCETLSFESYCSAALSRVGAAAGAGPARAGAGPARAGAGPARAGAGPARALARWRRVVALYSLRLALAPLVETLVLLDRALYVLESGLSCEILPVFDPKISPRNHIIIGKRL